MEMVAPKIRSYRCSKCGKHVVFRDESEEEICPFCLTRILKHKDCGGRLHEINILGLRQY